jgi:hypothetical protein
MRWLGMCAPVVLLARVLSAQPSVIAGDYLESRSNHVFGTYCEWSGERMTGGREAILAWWIKEGSMRGVSLAGVKIAAVIVGEATLSTGAAPRTSILFLDSAASPAQREAAESLLRERYGQLLGQVRNVHVAPVEFHRDAETAALSVGDVLNLTLRRARLPEDALPGATLWYDPFIPLIESTLGTALSQKYSGKDFGQRWERSDPSTSGYYGQFQLTLE